MQIARFHQMFLQVRFLEDYACDDGLLMRINQVLSRIPLEPISSGILDWFPSARRHVAARIEARPYRVVTQHVVGKFLAAIAQRRRGDFVKTG